MYAKFFKRFLDFWVALIALIVLSPLMTVLIITGAIAMRGNPFFIQKRPGLIDKKTGSESLFSLIKFRTMNNRKDSNGKLLPDADRLNGYGRFLRSTSLDELPSLFCVLIGTVSIVGPRPQLVRDMLFMTAEQRRRHTVRPGITGLAQVSGRNNISWFQKFDYDIEYIDSGITFLGDCRIILATVGIVLRRSDVVREGTASDIDFGDWLLREGIITQSEYNEKKLEESELIKV